MSLTSYRAAPPRAILVNRYAVYPVCANPFWICHGCVTALRCCIVPEQIGSQFVSCCILLCISAFGKQKGPLWAALCFRLGPLEVMRRLYVAFSRPGSDRLSRVLRRSTIGAGAFHGRVRNGNGCSRPAMTTRSAKRNN